MMPQEYVTIEQLKAKGVGIFNGEPMGLHYNREQKRRYVKEHKHDKNASHCIYCNARTATITDDYGDYICELCGIEKSKGIKTVEIKPDSYTTEITSGYHQVLEESELEAMKELEDLTEDDIPWLRGEDENE